MAQLPLIFPELLLALGALVLLLVGVYSGERSYFTVTGLAIALILATGLVIIISPKVGIFGGNALILDGFSRYMKILMLVGALFALIMSVGFAKAEKFAKFEFPVLVLLSLIHI